MKLTTLLQKHDATHAKGLSLSLGDGYLVENNAVYGAVRKKAQALDFKFSANPTLEYLAFPMSQLENILSAKTIYFQNNSTILSEIDQKIPQQIEWDHIGGNLKANYTFHESCHAIARTISNRLGLAAATSQKTKLVTMLLEESFANTCEFMAIHDAADATHKTFLEVNSFFTKFDDRTHLRNLVQEVGFKKVFKFMMFAYLHSNFLNEHFSSQEFTRVTKLTFDHKALKNLSKNAFELSPGFRFNTTELYLRFNGIKEPVLDALAFDYLAVIEQDPTFLKLINELTEIF
ncbi:hypothetical protein CIK05_05695 [Bdellovibrio sp. qaytius]|nr:hypothetical protein CIK05_05695 [Bdellovibrio sp. qaytius]